MVFLIRSDPAVVMIANLGHFLVLSAIYLQAVWKF